MSFNRLNYDTGTYRKELNQSVGPGLYHLNQPGKANKPCIPTKPGLNLQKSGACLKKNTNMVDLDSELLGLFRKQTRNPDKHYKPLQSITSCNDGEPCGNGVSSCCSYQTKITGVDDSNILHYADCFQPPEDTRLSNPPSTLKEIGFNRFEWLCRNPQQNIEKPFATNICNRTLIKDNHIPEIPIPLDETSCLPQGDSLPKEYTKSVTANNIGPNQADWRCCDYLKTC